MAVGLGTVDMPVPAVAEWEWLNWKFPRPIHAGETIYARWILTQKRPPAVGAPSSIVVWRVDVHTADGTLCAEGEVGAKVRRLAAAARQGTPEAATTPGGAPVPPARRRRRRRAANGTVPETPAVAAPPAPAAKPAERAAATSRRRRRRRPTGGSATPRDGNAGSPSPTVSVPAVDGPAPQPAGTGRAQQKGTLSRVIGRLRRT